MLRHYRLAEHRLHPSAEFSAWLDSLSDSTIRAIIAARIRRLEHGLF